MSLRRLLDGVTAPALPVAPPDYETGFFNRLSNILRLYFNRIDATINALLNVNGGALISNPYGAFMNLAVQTFAVANTPYVVAMDTTQGAQGLSLGSNRITFGLDGIYNVIWNMQFSNANTAIQDCTVWLRKNGADIPNSAFYFTIAERHGSVDGTADQTANFGFVAAAGDYIELVAAVTNTQVSLYYEAAQVAPYAHPSVPSTYVTVTFISAV
jgi:hypothetical protein